MEAQPETRESIQCLYYRDRATDGVLSFKGEFDAETVAEDLRRIAQELCGGTVPRPSPDDSSLRVTILTAADVARRAGTDPVELARVLERLARVLEVSGWGGDDGFDIVINDALVNVKTTQFGYDKNRVPLLKVKEGKHHLLKVKEGKHQKNLERLQSDDPDSPDEMLYYLVEQVDDRTARLIGYIYVSRFTRVCDSISKFETYKPGEEKYNWTSRAENYFCEPDELWISYSE